MEINTVYYNFYNVEGRFQPKGVQTPPWKKEYEVTEDEIRRSNKSKDSDAYKAYSKLEEIYYGVSVKNRSKYHTYDELQAAMTQKYFDPKYRHLNSAERDAMMGNEMEMTLYGCLRTGGNVSDPRLNMRVMDPTDSEEKSYNREMLNKQIHNLLTKNGVDTSLLKLSDVTFSVDPFHHFLTVYGIDDKALSSQVQDIMNTGNNASELFYHLLYNTSPQYSESVSAKYTIMKEFQYRTGQDIRSFTQTKDGSLIGQEGRDMLDLYREALDGTSYSSEKKSLYYGYINSLMEYLRKEDFSLIPDLYLSVGYKNGSLYDIADDTIPIEGFQAYA